MATTASITFCSKSFLAFSSAVALQTLADLIPQIIDGLKFRIDLLGKIIIDFRQFFLLDFFDSDFERSFFTGQFSPAVILRETQFEFLGLSLSSDRSIPRKSL